MARPFPREGFVRRRLGCYPPSSTGSTTPRRKPSDCTEGPLLVLAGAGTGKTRVVTRRIAHLLARGVPASSILALTFTRRAAEEMKLRLAELVGPASRRATVCTFHSLGFRILREQRGEVHPDIDFEDMIRLPLEMLQGDEGLRAGYHRRWTHLLVDEYQDTNDEQYHLLRALLGPGRNLCVVGDDDQSIYGFRGANVERILGFQDDFAGSARGHPRGELPQLRPGRGPRELGDRPCAASVRQAAPGLGPVSRAGCAARRPRTSMPRPNGWRGAS